MFSLSVVPGVAELSRPTGNEPLEERDLPLLADALAFELKFDGVKALWHPSIWYREQVGADVCSPLQALRLRRMTADRCPNVASSDVETERETARLRRVNAQQSKRSEHLNAATFLTLLIVVFAMLFIIQDSRNHDDAAAFDQQYGVTDGSAGR